VACSRVRYSPKCRHQSRRTERSLKGQRRPGDKACWLFAVAHDRATNKGINEIYSRAAIAIPLSRSEALVGIAQVILQSPPRTVFNHRRSNMMKFPSTLDDESLLTYEVSDEALETAGGKEIAANFTLGSCTGLATA
jgi:hypothetical protein